MRKDKKSSDNQIQKTKLRYSFKCVRFYLLFTFVASNLLWFISNVSRSYCL